MAQPTKISSLIDQRLWQQDAARYFRDVLRIQDEHGKTVPLELNAHQMKVQQAIDEQKRLRLPVRIIVLKERKAGTSTVGVANLYRETRFNPADSLVVAHDVDSTEYIFGIARRFHDEAPEGERWPLEASNRKELSFVRGGRLLVKTAGTGTAGRGFTPLRLLCSEEAYYPEAKKVMNSLLNSVPDTPESMVIKESTANGEGGAFYEDYWKAKNGQSAYKAIFLCWKDLPKHSTPVSRPEEFEASLTSHERRMREDHGLSLEQLAWRRWAIENKCGGDPDIFKQEYPLTDMEAFLSSGRGRFDREALAQIVTSEPMRGYLETEDSYESGKKIVFIPNREGWLSVWRKPQRGRKYVLPSDIAEGIEIAGASGENRYDWSVGDVFDSGTAEQVAQIRCQLEPDQFGRQLDLLGRWYNFAFQAPERNNNGESVINELVHLGYPEALIYARLYSGEGSRFATPQKGWKTTQVTRIQLINALDRAIRGREITLNSEQTIREMRTFKIKANGRAEAAEGCNDDCVIPVGIFLMVLGAAPGQHEEPPEPTGDLKVIQYKHANPIYR